MIGVRRRPEVRASAIAAVAAVAVPCAVLVATVWRLRLGLDLTDEAFYVTVPYHYLLGGVPFVGETSANAVTAGLVAYPLVAAYHAINGLDGLVLFMRFAQLVLSVITGGVIGLVLRRRTGWSPALMIGATAVAFVPFNLHVISYNTVACDLLACGLFLAFDGVRRNAQAEVVVAGACLGVAGFAYPPLIGATLVTMLIWVTRSDRKAAVAGALAPGIVLPIVGLGALAAAVGTSHMFDAFRNTSRYFGEGGGLGKFAAGARLWISSLPPTAGSVSASVQIVAHFGWLALPLFPIVRRRRAARDLLAGVWVPSLVAALIVVYSSANGEVNFGVGFFPAFLVTVVFLVWALRTPVLGVIAAALVVVLLMVCGLAVYRDAPVGRLTAEVRSGAYAGIYTSHARRAYLEQLQLDLGRLSQRCRLLVFDDVPAGYLLTSASPDTDSTWTTGVNPRKLRAYRDLLLAYYRTTPPPQVVVQARRSTLWGTMRPEAYSASDPLVAFVQRHYQERLRRSAYAIYALPDASALCPVGRARSG